MQNPRYRNGFNVTLHDDLVNLPRSWKKGRLVFVNSMSDLFHEDIPLSFILRVFETMTECPQHTFQVLTKRSERLRELAPALPWTENIWMGVSVEDKRSIGRISDLSDTPALVKFLSCEPLIGPLRNLSLNKIDWVIVGCESGPKARPMKQRWVEDIQHQCAKSEVAFFFKQWGGVRKHTTGRELNGRTYDEMPLAMPV